MCSKTEAAYKILKEAKKPLHVAEIVKIAIAKKMNESPTSLRSGFLFQLFFDFS
jgi:hypothetical protein